MKCNERSGTARRRRPATARLAHDPDDERGPEDRRDEAGCVAGAPDDPADDPGEERPGEPGQHRAQATHRLASGDGEAAERPDDEAAEREPDDESDHPGSLPRCPRRVTTSRSVVVEVAAEIAANVWQVPTAVGHVVAAGDTIAILESMKME